MKAWGVLSSFASMALSGRLPSRRALAAVAKLSGWRVERRWPFLAKASQQGLNLGFDDLLELQFARSRHFAALIVGAFDGVSNDPTSAFVLERSCKAVYVEPQPGPFGRLANRMAGEGNITVVNAAIDQHSGTRSMYCVVPGIEALPSWTEQLASFSKEHLLMHEHRAPGLSASIVEIQVPTLSFEELLDRHQLSSLDVLQIDAEGMDAALLAWFPFDRVKPGVLHFETSHMKPEEHRAVTRRLSQLGYKVRTSDSPTDDMAILF